MVHDVLIVGGLMVGHAPRQLVHPHRESGFESAQFLVGGLYGVMLSGMCLPELGLIISSLVLLSHLYEKAFINEETSGLDPRPMTSNSAIDSRPYLTSLQLSKMFCFHSSETNIVSDVALQSDGMLERLEFVDLPSGFLRVLQYFLFTFKKSDWFGEHLNEQSASR